MANRPFYGEYAWAYELLTAHPVEHMCDGIEELTNTGATDRIAAVATLGQSLASGAAS